MNTLVRKPTRFTVRTGGREVAVVEGWSPSEALVEYLRGRGFQDSDVVRVGYDRLAWRGQIFTAVTTTNEPRFRSR